MKVTLEFDSIEDSEEARDALNGTKWRMAMVELDQKLRETTKYNKGILEPLKDASEIEIEVADRIREVIREILDNKQLKLD